MIKIFLGCIGKYIRDSGAESIWIENGIFDPNVTQAVLGGSHYVRSLAGMTLLSEAMERLQWEAFFDECGLVKYQGVLSILREMKENVSEKNRFKKVNSFLVNLLRHQIPCLQTLRSSKNRKVSEVKHSDAGLHSLIWWIWQRTLYELTGKVIGNYI